ncbi:MAG: hypothetical protein H6816_01365 [Phycisphaerales bacterium]|nr:hypothetical protein [Phycisphaerales bacterium]
MPLRASKGNVADMEIAGLLGDVRWRHELLPSDRAARRPSSRTRAISGSSKMEASADPGARRVASGKVKISSLSGTRNPVLDWFGENATAHHRQFGDTDLWTGCSQLPPNAGDDKLQVWTSSTCKAIR